VTALSQAPCTGQGGCPCHEAASICVPRVHDLAASGPAQRLRAHGPHGTLTGGLLTEGLLTGAFGASAAGLPSRGEMHARCPADREDERMVRARAQPSVMTADVGTHRRALRVHA
jgi:hypothetical protein